MPYIGEDVQRIDAVAKVKGEAFYPGDINQPGQVYMKVLFASKPHAIIRRIDTEKAEILEGVIAVFTAKDVPVNEFGLSIPDQPVLCGPGSNKPFADRVRFIGDKVALVIAETEEIASAARDLITVEYEDLPIITDPLAAMKPDAILLHPEKESNVFCHYRIRKGDTSHCFRSSGCDCKR